MNKSLKIAIVGAGGRLGAALRRAYDRTAQVTGFTHRDVDLADTNGLRKTLGACDFDMLINAAAQTNVDRCETERAEAFALNAEAPRVLAEICRKKGARLVHISTDYVFDGKTSVPYPESGEAEPISVYGESKLEGERLVLAVHADFLVARVSWLFGPDRPSFVDWVIDQARRHERVEAVADKISTPTYTVDIATMLRLVMDSDAAGGVWHLANRGECSWQEYGQYALDCCRSEGVSLRANEVSSISLGDMKNFVARRPVYSVLGTEKYEKLTGAAPRHWKNAVADYVRKDVARRERS